MRYEANYYGVGHGLFCCGALYTGNSKTTSLNYIYDCGTSDSQGTLKRHIDEVVDKLPNRPLDLLFLSHMHKDHVSGLPYLLDQLKKKIKKNKCVQKIILPYFYPAERVVLFAEALENQFNNDIDDRYQSFLIAPESFLLDHGAEEVVFVRGGDDPKSLLSGFPQQEPSNGDADFNNLDERPLDVAIDPKFESTLTEQCRSHEKQLGGDSLSGSIITSRSVINTRYWFFVLYNKDVDDNKLQQFLKQFESLRDEKSIEQVLTDSQKRREIKNAYKKLVGDINNSSLAVLFTCNVQKFCLPRHCFMDFIGESQPGRCFCFNYIEKKGRPCGFVYTGDLPVKKFWDELRCKFKLDGQDSSTFTLAYQIPHHGSIKNWNCKQAEISTKPFYVLSAGVNSDCHPSSKVLRDICKNNGRLSWVHENNSCCFVLHCNI